VDKSGALLIICSAANLILTHLSETSVCLFLFVFFQGRKLSEESTDESEVKSWTAQFI